MSKRYDPLHHSYRARQAKRRMFHLYGRTCHLCGHGGAGEADLIIPRAKAPYQIISPHIYRPAHGSNSRCPTCDRCCNQERGTKPVGEVWRPKLAW